MRIFNTPNPRILTRWMWTQVEPLLIGENDFLWVNGIFREPLTELQALSLVIGAQSLTPIEFIEYRGYRKAM